jgi:hypothetical protein
VEQRKIERVKRESLAREIGKRNERKMKNNGIYAPGKHERIGKIYAFQ